MPEVEPTGSWAEVIEHLRAAHALMEEMDLADPFGEQSLGDIFKRQVEAIIVTVEQHYVRAYWKVATRVPRVEVTFKDPGTEEWGSQHEVTVWPPTW